jgi:fructosamine-3-kinase
MDKDAALNLLIKEYPFLNNKNMRIVKQFVTADGRVSNSFLVESGLEGFEKFIAKSFVRHPESLRREWIFLDLLTKKKADAPRLLVDGHEPECFLLMEYVDGIPASEAVQQTHDIDGIFTGIGEATGMANSIELETFGNILRPSDMSWKEHVLEKLKDKQRLVGTLVDEKSFNEITEAVEATKHVLDSESQGKPMLVHHDIYLENFLVKKADGQVVLIDYGIAYGGRPLFDLAKFYIWDLLRYPEQKSTFLKAYSRYVTIPPNFNEIMEFYLIYECFGMIAYFNMIDAIKDRDETIEILKDLVRGEGTISELIR